MGELCDRVKSKGVFFSAHVGLHRHAAVALTGTGTVCAYKARVAFFALGGLHHRTAVALTGTGKCVNCDRVKSKSVALSCSCWSASPRSSGAHRHR